MGLLSFKQWLEIFGQGIEEPVQRPDVLNNGANFKISFGTDTDLPPTPLNQRKIKKYMKSKSPFTEPG